MQSPISIHLAESLRGKVKFDIVVSCVLFPAKIFVFCSHEVVSKAFSYVIDFSPTSIYCLKVDGFITANDREKAA